MAGVQADRVRGWAALLCDVGALSLTVSACSSGPIVHDAQWTLVRRSPAASTVFISWFHGACDTLAGGSAEVSATTVTIRLLERSASSGDSAGMGIGQLVRVRLGTPLGVRAITGCHPAHRNCPVVAVSRSWTPRKLRSYHLPVVGP
jgi:hypothetical protein